MQVFSKPYSLYIDFASKHQLILPNYNPVVYLTTGNFHKTFLDAGQFKLLSKKIVGLLPLSTSRPNKKLPFLSRTTWYIWTCHPYMGFQLSMLQDLTTQVLFLWNFTDLAKFNPGLSVQYCTFISALFQKHIQSILNLYSKCGTNFIGTASFKIALEDLVEKLETQRFVQNKS